MQSYGPKPGYHREDFEIHKGFPIATLLYFLELSQIEGFSEIDRLAGGLGTS